MAANLFRSAFGAIRKAPAFLALQKAPLPSALTSASTRSIHFLTLKKESEEQFDSRYECFFSRQDIDGWEIRQAMNDINGYDLVPEPRIIAAALHACRRVNDYALAVRFLEMIKNKCGAKEKEIYPYVIQEIAPVLCELGIDTPEELGYDKPELWCEDVYDY